MVRARKTCIIVQYLKRLNLCTRRKKSFSLGLKSRLFMLLIVCNCFSFKVFYMYVLFALIFDMRNLYLVFFFRCWQTGYGRNLLMRKKKKFEWCCSFTAYFSAITYHLIITLTSLCHFNCNTLVPRIWNTLSIL